LATIGQSKGVRFVLDFALSASDLDMQLKPMGSRVIELEYITAAIRSSRKTIDPNRANAFYCLNIVMVVGHLLIKKSSRRIRLCDGRPALILILGKVKLRRRELHLFKFYWAIVRRPRVAYIIKTRPTG
jgi:hypothetical protein